MTSDHLFPLTSSEGDVELLFPSGVSLGEREVPNTILQAFRLGKLTALGKPDGGVRGIVVGDIIRRLVARTIAKQVSKKAGAATAPFQYALHSSVHNQRGPATVISIDGVSAYDLISRNAMLEGGDQNPFFC